MNRRDPEQDRQHAQAFLQAYWLSQENPKRQDLALAALDILTEHTAAIKDQVPVILEATYPSEKAEVRMAKMFARLAEAAPHKVEELRGLGYADIFPKKSFWKIF
ncbi:MAG: hypothetical protein RI911_869 [Candidatus Parcubacteria bacterium]|jgi:hypothetical protein